MSLAFPLQNLMIAVCAGTTVGMNALLSRSLGAKEQERADRAANTGIFLALASFVVFAIVGPCSPAPSSCCKPMCRRL